jgi:hypothetical protein
MTTIPGKLKEELSDIAAQLFDTLQEGIELVNGEPMFHSPEAGITFEYEGKRYRLSLVQET